MLDRESHDVTVAGKPVELTAKEFDLLAYFLANTGMLLSRDLLLDRVWGLEYPGGTRTVDVHVAQLRRKLGRPDLIRTLRGVGLQGRRAVNSLRGRLFAATLAALGLTLALTIAIGAVLTRRQVDRTQVAALAQRADDLAQQRRRSPNYINLNRLSGNVRIIVQPRSLLAPYVAERQQGERRQDDVRGR